MKIGGFTELPYTYVCRYDRITIKAGKFKFSAFDICGDAVFCLFYYFYAFQSIQSYPNDESFIEF